MALRLLLAVLLSLIAFSVPSETVAEERSGAVGRVADAPSKPNAPPRTTSSASPATDSPCPLRYAPATYRRANETGQFICLKSGHFICSQHLRALASLAQLEALNLDATGADAWGVAALGGLKRLSLRDNGVGDVSALAGLGSLRALDLAGNAVADVAPLAGLAAVKALDLRGNPVADFSPLVVLPVLARLDADGEAAGTNRAGLRSRALARSPRDTHDGNGSPEGSR